MDNFDLRKYLAEGRLYEEKLTPLQKYIFNYESNISDEVDMTAIKGLKNADDVYDYYAAESGWEDDEDLKDDLENIYNQVKVKFGEGKLNEQYTYQGTSGDTPIDLSSREYSAKKLFALIARDLKFSSRVQDNEMLNADEALEIMRKVIEIEGSEISPEAALGEYILDGEL